MITKSISSKANLKQTTNADWPINPAIPTTNEYLAVSTAGQTVINLSYSLPVANVSNFFLFVDGKRLTYGASNDFTLTNVQSNGTSNQVTLNFSLVVGLNIAATFAGVAVPPVAATSIATVQAQIAPAYRVTAASSGITASDKIVEFICSAGSRVATLPDAATVPVGQPIKIVRSQDSTPANTLSINTTSGQTISSRASGSIKLQPLDYIEVVSDGSNWHAVQMQETIQYLGLLPTTTIGTSNTLLNYSGVTINTHGAYSGGVFTAPCNGKFDYDAQAVSATNLTGQWNMLSLKNGVITYNEFIKAGTGFGNTYQGVQVSGTVDLLAGETFAIYSYANISIVTASYNQLSIRKSGN